MRRRPGATLSDFAVVNRGDFRGQGLPILPIYRPPHSRTVAIAMNTGEHLWETPNGDSPSASATTRPWKAWTCRTPAFRSTR